MTVVVVGTAGHVDHGKSALVERLTGVNPDRLPEERRRGMTIDLGFAHAQLPGGVIASFVDVPGHEDFIRNMLAGAGGVRAALIVVAADESVMPQTREHVAILHLLGVHHGLVALTKVDLIEDEDELSLVADDVEDLLRGTTLEGIEMLPVSAASGAGIEAVANALGAVLARAGTAPDLGRPRMAVDRVFSKVGFGTVVTGTLRDGAFSVGDDLVLAPGGLPVKVRGLQSHGLAVETAPPGSRVAVNLKGPGADAATRGDWLIRPADYPVSPLIDIAVELVADADAHLAHDDALIVFAGCAAVPARVRLLGSAVLSAGGHGYAQLVLSAPIVAAAGDRIVLRRPSPGATIGGGTVLDPAPPRRHRRSAPGTLVRFAAMESADPDIRVAGLIAAREPCPRDALTAAVVGLSTQECSRAIARLLASGSALALGDTILTAEGAMRLTERAGRYVAAHHSRNPQAVGPSREELRTRLGLDRAAFGAWLAEAEREGRLTVDGHAVRLPDHRGAADPATGAQAEALLARIQAAPFAPPSPHELEAEFTPQVVMALIRRGDLVRLDDAVILHRAAYSALREMVMHQIADNDSITVAWLRDRATTSRRVVLAVLERLDAERVTRRDGDVRVRGAAWSGPAPSAGQNP